MGNKNYVKEAEKNVVRIAKHLDDMFKVVDALERFGNKFFIYQNARDRDLFFAGVQNIRDALYSRYTFMLSQCFNFVGVGGEEAKKYSFEKFKEQFGDTLYSVMHFLDQYGNHPSWYAAEVDKEFRKQAKELIEKKANDCG